MASVYTNDLRLEEIGSGEQSGSWGDTTNTNLELIAEAFAFGTEAITTNADTHATTIADGATDPGRSLFLKYTGTLDSACTITIGPNTVSKLWFIENGTSGSQNIIIKQGSGATITIAAGQTKAIYSNGAGSGGAMVDAFAALSVVDLIVSDDLVVGDDLGVTGLVTIGETLAVTGIATFTDDIIIGDGKTIGSASDVDAITIAANGQVTLTQTLIGTALDISGDIDVDGTTNLDNTDIDGTLNASGLSYVNSGNGSGVALKIGGEGGEGLKTQYIIASGHTNYQIGVASHAASVFSITPSTAAGNTTFTNPALNISAGGQAQFTDGTASLPAISNIGDVNTGILFPAADTIGFSTAGAERARINSDGDLCVGSSEGGNAGQLTISIGTAGSVDGGVQVWARTNGSSFVQFGDGTSSADNYRGYIAYSHATDILSLGVLSATKLTINSQGVTSIGTTGTAGQLSLKATGDRCVSTMQVNANGDAGICFLNTSANGAGNIIVNASSVSYGTSSDYRLKENVDYDWDATTRLKQLKPARFNFIADNTNTLVDGFIAHEAQTVVPEAVHGTHNETQTLTKVVLSSSSTVLAENIEQSDWTAGKSATTDEDGNAVTAIYPSDSTWAAEHVVPKMQGIDQAKIVPLLVKTIQELEARITALES